MKKTMTKITLAIAGLALTCFWPVTTQAQEVHPDNYESKNTAVITPAPVKVDFQGKFSLPYQVRCGPHKLAPGQYTVVVKTVGENKMVTLQRDESDILELPVHNVSQSSVLGQSAMMVRHGPGPRLRTLEAVYMEKLNMVLYLDETGIANFLDKMFAGVKHLPIL